MGSKEYFGKLRAKALSDEVGSALYSYVLGVDTNGFTPQNFPVTQSKKVRSSKD